MEDEREHYMSIDADESRHAHPECGCTLELGEFGMVRYFPCAVHDSARDMLEALKRYRSHRDDPTYDGKWDLFDEEVENLIAKASGR